MGTISHGRRTGTEQSSEQRIPLSIHTEMPVNPIYCSLQPKNNEKAISTF